MILYRVFDWDGKAKDDEPGGPLHVPRAMQGPGRFDIPHLDGVLYASLSQLGAVAETLQGFRSRVLTNRYFERPDGREKTIVTFELKQKAVIIDLDDAAILAQRHLKPSEVITHQRELTHPIAERLYKEGAAGLVWPSSIEGTWKNASLFESRIQNKLEIISAIKPLTIYHADVKKAASWLHLPLVSRLKVRRK